MKYYGLELIEQLCAEFGPSGCCDNVREAIIAQIAEVIDSYYVDRTGTLVVKVCGGGEGYDAKNPRRVLLCTGMDEVGMIVNRVHEKGHLHFGLVGDIDPRVLGGKTVLIGDGERMVKGRAHLAAIQPRHYGEHNLIPHTVHKHLGVIPALAAESLNYRLAFAEISLIFFAVIRHTGILKLQFLIGTQHILILWGVLIELNQ